MLKRARRMTSGPVKAIATLTLLAAAIAAGLAGLNELTAERIAVNIAESQAQTLREVLPAGRYNNVPAMDIQQRDAPRLAPDEPTTIYRARRGSQPIATAIPVDAPDGYVSNIRLLVGLDTSGVITGVRVLEHNETPGLGDRIDTAKSDWLLQFSGLSASNPEPAAWALSNESGEFDQITGATITSRAALRAIRRVLDFHAEQGSTLFGATPAADSP